MDRCSRNSKDDMRGRTTATEVPSIEFQCGSRDPLIRIETSVPNLTAQYDRAGSAIFREKAASDKRNPENLEEFRRYKQPSQSLTLCAPEHIDGAPPISGDRIER